MNLFVNRYVSTSSEELNLPRNLLCLKPDIVTKHEKQIKILEVSCPYDLYLLLCSHFRNKKSKYAPLKDAIESKGYQCDIMPFIVWSVGLVHMLCYVYLIQLGIPKRQAKGFCKWCSNSNIFFARNIWNTRCRLEYDWLFIVLLSGQPISRWLYFRKFIDIGHLAFKVVMYYTPGHFCKNDLDV